VGFIIFSAMNFPFPFPPCMEFPVALFILSFTVLF
jgi:hypothetical protein